ncbi:MAG: glycosyl hydrolase, partial [Gammaproteobacteria bacterium]|nr:glycosyl hydrolase [Gammaproteobacteria bacterium]
MNEMAMGPQPGDRQDDQRIAALLGEMTLGEKIGQLNQLFGQGEHLVDHLRPRLQAGQVGSVINVVDLGQVNEMQRIAVEESRLGIPLLFGRDVIHGFKTVMPIPLGQ